MDSHRFLLHILLTLNFILLSYSIAAPRKDNVTASPLDEAKRKDELGVVAPKNPFVRVVCYYYAVEAWYRRGRGMFLPSDVDVEQCTHLHYAYATADADTFLIKPQDPWAEIDNRFYERVTGLRKKNPSMRVLLSLGGWSEPSSRFSQLVADAKNRKAFVDHVVTFLQLHEFDGLDLAWFFPVCWGGECTKSNSEDRDNFSLLLIELKSAFEQLQRRLLLSIVASGDPQIFDRAYDVASLSRLDYINVMTFDNVAYWHGKTGHHASLYAQAGFPSNVMNVNASVRHLIAKGISPKRIVVGIATYGRTFQLINPLSHGVGSPVRGPGSPGEFTNSEGLLAHYEVCDRILKKGWHKASDQGLPYAYLDDQWISYEDAATATLKARYIKQNGLGGAMIWDIDRDDFRGSCYGKKFPILSAVTAELFGTQRVAFEWSQQT